MEPNSNAMKEDAISTAFTTAYSAYSSPSVNILMIFTLAIITLIFRVSFPCLTLHALEQNLELVEETFHLRLVDGSLSNGDSVGLEVPLIE